MSTLLKKTLLSTPPENGSATVSAFSIAFIALIFFAERAGLLDTSRYLAGTGRQVFEQHHYWRAFTTTLVHADLGHLFSNSIFFTGLAFLLNGYFGKWIFPVLSFLAGGVINLMILPQYPADVAIIGASGIVYFMAALWLTLYFMIDRRHSIARRLINVIALSLILFVPEVLQERVSYLAHAVGFFLGIPAGTFLFALRKNQIRSHEVWQLPESTLFSEVPEPAPEIELQREELEYFEFACACGSRH